MKTRAQKILSIVLVLTLCFAVLPIVTKEAYSATPDYSVSSSYKASSYYEALCNVTLTGNQREDIVNVALSQVGYREGSTLDDYGGADDGYYNNYTEYNYWYHNNVSSGMPVGGGDAPWCATFVSWCAEQANIPASILKRSTAAGHGASYFNVNFYSGSSSLASSSDNDSYFKGYNYTPQKGDLFFTRSWSHVGLVVGVSGNYVITVEGNTNNNGSSQGNGVYRLTWRKISDLYFGVPNYSADPISLHQSDPTYSAYLPIAAFPISSDHISVYDEYGTILSNRYIDGATDICLIQDIYTDGWCKVTYPSSAEESGHYTAYVPFSTFVSSPNPTTWVSDKEYTVYRKSDMQEPIGDVTLDVAGSGVSCLAVGGAGESRQVIYPIDDKDYCVMGWISTPKEIHLSADVINMTVGETKTVYVWTTGYYHGATILAYAKQADTINCAWGDRTDGKYPLTITASAPGTVLVEVGVKIKDTGDVLDAIGLTVVVTDNCDTGHSYGEWYIVKEASCIEKGEERRDCSNCDYYETRLVAAKDHSYTTVVTAPTCTARGYTTHTCTNCGYSYKDSYVDATGHNYGEWVIVKEATTTETGLAERVCANCSDTEQKVLDKLDAPDPNSPQVIVENVTAKAGETVSIPVYIENNPGVAYAKFKVDYSDALELISVENKGILTGTFTTSKATDVKPYVVQWMGADDATGNGCFLVLTFRVSGDADAGNYHVTISCEEAYNSVFEDVVLVTTSGTVTVKDFIPGDVNGDGEVNGKDGILLAQFLTEWEVTIDMDAADVNGDGEVNGKDGILLAQFLAEWDVTLG